MPGTTPDFVIVGAGLAGCALAYELGRHGAKVTVVDRGTVGSGSSARNAGGVRQQFAQATNIEAARRTISRMKTFVDELGVDPGFRQVGYLFLASTPTEADMFRRASDAQRQYGVRSHMIDVTDIAGLVPGIRTDDLVAGLFSPDDGIVDPNSVVTGFAQGARRFGVRIIEGNSVISASVDSSGFTELSLHDGGHIGADIIVNAAGAWAPQFASLLGSDLPVTAWRSQLFILDAELGGGREMPLTIDWSNRKLVMHREGPGLLVGCDNEGPGDPAVEPACDWEKLPEMAGRVQHRMPHLGGAGVMRGWAGYLELTPDENPLVGWTTLGKHYVFAGFSGHGFSIVPGLAADAARDLLRSAPQLDLSPYRPERFSGPPVEAEAFSLR
jgi:sarcosine oxidase subunit beta